ncbi:MAG: hydantoinase/oxoprolinase family protein [Terriglobales bacterium]
MSRRPIIHSNVIRCGIDTGGTFTDLIAVNEATGNLIISKFPSSQKDPVKSIVRVIQESGLDLERTASVVLGTTLGLNALLQRGGARVIFVTTAGFEDVLFIQRMNRRYHYSFDWVKPKPLVEHRDCLGVRERIDAHGKVLVPLNSPEMHRLANEIEVALAHRPAQDTSIAVCLLFSYLNPEHELGLRKYLESRFPKIPISLSHEVAPIWREYERGCTTVVDAFIKPILARYIAGVRACLNQLGSQVPWTIMKSNGGHATPEAVEKQPVNTVLSGLSGGIVGAKYFGDLAGEKNLVTLDMGGTSCDVGLVRDGALSHVTNYEVEWGMPISAPFVDVSSIGAGGGSIALVDKGGFLRVGPQSAGADPGPACYDQGGIEATVTDANLVLGRLNPDYFLGGKMKLNSARAESAVSALGNSLGMGCAATAQAIIDIADENMANAIRVISVERGIDPRDYALVSFGGAGPLHTGGIAEKIGMRRIIVPLYPGLCSAFGTLIADFQVDKILSQHFRSSKIDAAEINKLFNTMVKLARTELREEGYSGTQRIQRSISMRYAGQNYEHDVTIGTGAITRKKVDLIFEKFHNLHERFYGYSISKEVIELIRFNVSVIGASKVPRLKDIPKGRLSRALQKRPVYFKNHGYVTCPVFRRGSLPADTKLRGPAVIEEQDSTILLHPGNMLRTNKKGVLTITL